MTLKRTEMKRGTKAMSRGAPMSRGTSQLARSGPIKAKAPKNHAQRVQIEPLGGVLALAPAVVVVAPKKAYSGLKSRGPKMSAIRKSAQNEECTLRFLCCNYRNDTTVLCHRNGAGGGMKAPDTDAAYGCYACHVVLDGHAPRPEGFTREMMLARFDVAVGLTHIRLAVKGLIRLLADGRVEVVEKTEHKKQKPTPARTGVGLKTHQLSEQLMTEKIVPHLNYVVGRSALQSSDFSQKSDDFAPLAASLAVGAPA
jgi:hypothetical protein